MDLVILLLLAFLVGNFYKTTCLIIKRMKRGILLLITLVILLQLTVLNAATICDLDVILLNQDPYPAIPGESVKVVFQINGMNNPNCGDVRVTLKEAFPFTLDGAYKPTIYAESGTYVKDFESFLLAPYKLNIDADALDGANNIDLDIYSSSGILTYSFDIELTDTRTDFEVSVKNYDKATKTLTFEILNSGEHDVEALTIDIPKQDTLAIKGSSRNIIGSLDSNDDTTFSFEAVPSNGEIKLIITYTDEIDERRTIEKTIMFDKDYFDDRAAEDKGMSIWFYITLLLVAWMIFTWWRKRSALKRRRLRHS
jgi:hypothetical protein